MRTIKGKVICKSTSSIESDAVLTVSVQDCSLQDAPSVTLGKQLIKDPDTFPVEFEVEFNDDVVKKQIYGIYSLSASISSSKNKLLFVNDTMHSIVGSDAKILDTLDIEVIKI